MANYSVKGYAKVYASPEDLDLWSAGITERPLPGSMVGPTFACLIGKQFHNFRFGDRLVSVLFKLLILTLLLPPARFWYENGGWPSSFTLEQLAEIRRVKLSRVLCDNSDDLETVQVGRVLSVSVMMIVDCVHVSGLRHGAPRP